MKAKDFLEEIDYYNTNVEGQLYEELGIETLADMIELYHERKLKLLGIANVGQQRELLIADFIEKYNEGLVGNERIHESCLEDYLKGNL